jgi:hypothetical protein
LTAGFPVNDLFRFISAILVIITVVALVWPLNVPLLALAFKVRHGIRPLPYDEPKEFWLRSAGGALGLCGISLVVLLLAYLLVDALQLQDVQGPIELVLLLLYVPAAVVFLFWMFAMEDLMEALGVFLLYVLLPALPLLLLNWIFHFSQTLPSWLWSSSP